MMINQDGDTARDGSRRIDIVDDGRECSDADGSW